MDVTSIPLDGDRRVDMHWSSAADMPHMWLRLEGGEMIDPRDPACLTRLPVTNSAHINLSQARALRAALDHWIQRLTEAEAERPSPYLDVEDEK